MSQALGPIHQWIFAQLGLVEERGESIVKALIEEHGEEAANAWLDILTAHPGRFAGKDLASLVGDAAIHASLEGMIATVQIREAKLVAWAAEQDAMELVQQAYAAHGSHWGTRVNEAAAPKEAPALFSGLRELWLEGMPCDIRVDLLDENPGRMRWAVPELTLSKYWEGSGCSPESMFELHGMWMAAFVEAAAEEFTWSLPASAFAGAERFEFEISRK
ncbi:hypothetical protein H8E52_00350 [bacterium]|nr:hypothetical protein [bacterium]